MKNRWGMFLILMLCWLFQPHPASSEETYGRFVGEIVASFLPDGRNVKLAQPFEYVDHRGVRWEVPAGATTNGASIPQVLWLAYPPFTGKYRTAAVIHDYYCETRKRTWQEVHLAFYNAMRASGVDEITAKTMYGAVYAFGPRWQGIGKTRSLTAPKPVPIEKQKSGFEELQDWIARENPTPEAIEARVRDLEVR